MSRLKGSLFALAAIVLLLATGPARAQVLHGITRTGQLLTINPTTGVGTLIGTIPGASLPSDLAHRGAQLYTWDQSSSRIWELNPATAAVVTNIDIALTSGAEGGLAFRGDGIGFMSFSSGGIGNFHRFDITVPNSTPIGAPGSLVPSMDGLAFNAAGVLYGLSQGGQSLYTIDTTTGATTLVGNTTIPPGPLPGYGLAGLTFGPGGTLYGVVSSTGVPSLLFQINPATGVATFVGDVGFPEISGIAFDVAPATPGVTVTQSGGATAVAEGGATDTYTVVLNSLPTANVTITMNPGTQVTVAPATLTFTAADWYIPQTVTVTAVDDVLVEGPHTGTIAHTSVSTDAAYNGITIASVTANITDNDGPGVTITQSGGTTAVTEGGATDTYTVVLNTLPTANVTITMNPGTQVTVAPATLTFTAADWNIPQTVTVTAVDDVVVEGAHTGTIAHTSVSTDTAYNGIAIASVTVNITDNDGGPTPGVTVTQSGATTDVAEGGATDTYTVVLNTLPTANVTITMNPGTQVTVAPAALTFTAADWNVPQTVTVTAVDDAVVEGPHTGTIAHTSASTDAAYNGITIASVTVNITDNDAAATPGVTVTQSGGTTAVAEGGATDTYTVVLNSVPTANVTINLTPGTQLSVAPVSLTFTTVNWNVAQTVTVTAIDDALVEGPHTGTITHAAVSTDVGYNGIAIASVTANITDNDGPPAPPPTPPSGPEGSFTGSAGPTGREGSFGRRGGFSATAPALLGPLQEGLGHWRVFNISHQQKAPRSGQEAATRQEGGASPLAWVLLAALSLGMLVILRGSASSS